MYTVSQGTESVEHAERQAAIDDAKERSKAHRGEVTVMDGSGAEVLTYKGGELASYLWDDRK